MTFKSGNELVEQENSFQKGLKAILTVFLANSYSISSIFFQENYVFMMPTVL